MTVAVKVTKGAVVMSRLVVVRRVEMDSEAHWESFPEKVLRQVEGSQWAGPISHQPYWLPGVAG